MPTHWGRFFRHTLKLTWHSVYRKTCLDCIIATIGSSFCTQAGRWEGFVFLNSKTIQAINMPLLFGRHFASRAQGWTRPWWSKPVLVWWLFGRKACLWVCGLTLLPIEETFWVIYGRSWGLLQAAPMARPCCLAQSKNGLASGSSS